MSNYRSEVRPAPSNSSENPSLNLARRLRIGLARRLPMPLAGPSRPEPYAGGFARAGLVVWKLLKGATIFSLLRNRKPWMPAWSVA
jgi:hypothetical protein